jgi:selenide,water dikinase
VTAIDRLILADAQTSGGLLIAVAPERESALLEELERNATPARAVIGELLPGDPGAIEIVSS